MFDTGCWIWWRGDFRGDKKNHFFYWGFVGHSGDFIGHCEALQSQFGCVSYILW